MMGRVSCHETPQEVKESKAQVKRGGALNWDGELSTPNCLEKDKEVAPSSSPHSRIALSCFPEACPQLSTSLASQPCHISREQPLPLQLSCGHLPSRDPEAAHR